MPRDYPVNRTVQYMNNQNLLSNMLFHQSNESQKTNYHTNQLRWVARIQNGAPSSQTTVVL